MIQINLRFYLSYKLLNSLFLGVSLGTIFVIYTPLSPKTYSIGGIALALGAFVLTLFYTKILQTKPYKRILLGLEIVPFGYIVAYLVFPNTLFGAIVIYTLYQITFIFGDYLGRAETLIIKRKIILSWLDKYKQIGYILGLILAFVFYAILEFFGISQKESQIYRIHFLLLLLQCAVFLTLVYSFKKIRGNNGITRLKGSLS